MTPLEQNIYKIVDSFLVESTDQHGNIRSLERMNEDRHLAVKNLLELFEAERQRILNELPEPANIINNYGLSFNEMTGWNDCLSQVRNIISKPNI